MDKQYKNRYVGLKREFEWQLQRSLTKKEKDFIKWLVKQESKEKHCQSRDIEMLMKSISFSG